jgi:hypothetical protein
MTPTAYGDVNDIVAEVLDGATTALGGGFVGMYLGGSLATGAFDPGTSDIDFAVITAGDVDDAGAAALRASHDRITVSPRAWAKKLEGLYVPRDTARAHRERGQRCAYLGVGGWFGVVPYQADWIVQLHLVREHGIIVAGPDPKALIDPVTPGELRASCAAIMRDWEPLLADTGRFDAEYQAYTVLTMCRVLYTLEHGAVASKPQAVDWARERLGGEWTPLIDEAAAWRRGAPYDHLDDVLRLLRHTIDRSDQADTRESTGAGS